MLDEHGLDAGLSRPGRRGCADEAGAVQTQRAVLESTAPTKSAKSSESAAGADDESARFIVLGLTKTTGGLVGSRWGSGSDANSGKNRQRRFFDEHGLDAGLSRPGRKNRQGDALTKQGLFRHSGQCWNRQRRRNRRSRQNRRPVLTMSPDDL